MFEYEKEIFIKKSDLDRLLTNTKSMLADEILSCKDEEEMSDIKMKLVFLNEIIVEVEKFQY